MTNYPQPAEVCLHLDLVVAYEPERVVITCEWCGTEAEYPQEFLRFSPAWIQDSFTATFGAHHQKTPEHLRLCQSWPVWPV